jgi:hypothetical protein
MAKAEMVVEIENKKRDKWRWKGTHSKKFVVLPELEFLGIVAKKPYGFGPAAEKQRGVNERRIRHPIGV